MAAGTPAAKIGGQRQGLDGNRQRPSRQQANLHGDEHEMSSLAIRRTVPARPARTAHTTLGQVRYLNPGEDRPATFVPGIGTGDDRRRTGDYVTTTITVENLREVAGDLTLDRDAVVLRRQPSQVLDLYDEQAVSERYYEETERLIKAETGARRVLVFDHTRRVEGGPELEAKAERRPVRTVHNDYTDRSGPQRVRDLLGAEADELLKRRFAVINTWRPIRGPVLRAPLGFIHPDSMAPDDLIAADLHYPDRTGEIYDVAYSPAHRWLYVPEMRSDEILVFKCFDSATDGRARFLPHTGFDDFATPADATSRESIETRSLVFF